MAKFYGFTVAWDQVAPPGFGPGVPDPVRKAFLKQAVEWVLSAKDAELAAGLDRYGLPMAPLSRYTIEHRHSEMGFADPHAPPLEPAYGLSRTRSLLQGRYLGTSLRFDWAFDDHTRGAWGKTLDYHRRGVGKLPVRDVFGISPTSLSWVRQQARDWVHQYNATGKPPKLTPAPGPAAGSGSPGPPPASVAAAVPGPFAVKTVKAYQPRYPELAAPKAPHVVSQLGVNGHVYTLGAGVNGRASAAALRRGIAGGSFSGFHSGTGAGSKAALTKFMKKWGPGGPGPAPATGAPGPKPKPPAPPVTHPEVAPRVPKPEAPEREYPMPVSSGPFPKPKPKKPPKPKPPPLPSTLDGLTDVRALGGHGGANATLVKDSTGRLFVRKVATTNPGQLKEEAAADAAYWALGIDVPRSRTITTPDGRVAKVAEFAAGKTLKELIDSDPIEAEKAFEKLRKGFVADAILGNWDVIGASYDNILVTPDGRVLRIDNGGALRYRAQGSLKSSSQWSGALGELKSLRDPNVNPVSAKVFGGLTDADIKAQGKAVLRKKAALLKAVPEELRPTLEARLATLDAFVKAKAPRPVKGFKPSDPALFRQFTSSSEMDSWGEAAYRQWSESLTSDERDALGEYTGGGYSRMNRALREGHYGSYSPYGVDETITTWQGALSRGKLKEPIKVSRGIHSLRETGYSAADLAPGMTFVDKGFLSTTLKERPDFGSGCHIFINVRAGAPGAYVNASGRSRHQSEKEFTFPHGTEFRVVRIEEGPTDKVYLEWVPPAAKKSGPAGSS